MYYAIFIHIGRYELPDIWKVFYSLRVEGRTYTKIQYYESRREDNRRDHGNSCYGNSDYRRRGSGLTFGLLKTTPRFRAGLFSFCMVEIVIGYLRALTFTGLSKKKSIQTYGEVAEWSKAPVSKTGMRATASRVRIPPSPPKIETSCAESAEERRGAGGAAKK